MTNLSPNEKSNKTKGGLFIQLLPFLIAIILIMIIIVIAVFLFQKIGYNINATNITELWNNCQGIFII